MAPAGTQNDAHIPVVDLSSPTAANELLNAACEHGFIFVKHTADVGLAPQDVDEMFDISRDFFRSPTEVKASCLIHSSESGKNHGWLGPGTETLNPGEQKMPDQKEAFNLGLFSRETGRPQQAMPAPFKPHLTTLDAFQQACHGLCDRILTLLGRAFEMLDEGWFTERHHCDATNTSVLRLLYYPSNKGSPGGEEVVRAGAHTDYGSLTLLFRLPGQPGLEILTESGMWVPVPVDPSTNDAQQNGSHQAASSNAERVPILVNIGDVLSYWTNGLLKSTKHRVVLPEGGGEDRYSMAYFYQPDDDAELVEVPSPVVKQAANVFGVKRIPGIKTSKDHLDMKLKATYGIKA